MPDQNPFKIKHGDPKTSFLIGLATSTMDAFNKSHDREQKEDADRKQFDYQLLMDALKARVSTGNITQSEINEIMSRSVDIFKPKGHGGIKDRLKELFGRGDPYQMQSSGIMKDVAAKPRADVAGPPAQMPATIGGAVSLPPFQVPTTRPEPTLKESGIEDEQRKLQGQEQLIRTRNDEAMEKQAAHDLRMTTARQADIKLRTDESVRKFKITQPIREQGRAEAKLRSTSVSLFGDDSPEHMEAASRMLMADMQAKVAERQAKAQRAGIMARREDEKIDAYIASVGSRINAASGQQGLRYFKSKLDVLKGQIAAAENNKDALLKQMASDLSLSIEGPRKQAWTQAMAGIQGQIDELNGDLQQLAVESVEMQASQPQGVTLPNAPLPGGNRSGAKLTRQEIFDRGGSEADVEEARRKGVLAQ